jgi:hypothetical protein
MSIPEHRELKFRAWDKGNKVMRQPALVLHNGSKPEWLTPDNPDYKYKPTALGDIVWLQYTGLKDVYEGDIVKGVFEDNHEIEISGAVSWWDKGLQWVVGAGTDNGYALGSIAKLKVIGNIYEHKDKL